MHGFGAQVSLVGPFGLYFKELIGFELSVSGFGLVSQVLEDLLA